jgi:hypothetical protein
VNFVGTLDARALEVRVNNERVLRLAPAAESPNVIAGSSANQVAPGVVGGAVGGGGARNIGGTAFPNRVLANYGSVVGGLNNAVLESGVFGTVLGGRDNTVAGAYSLVGGWQAWADHANAFVWSDGFGGQFSSVADAEFAVRAAGGLRLVSERGLILNASDSPMITRGWDPFTSGSKAGLGRWGLFMENSHLVAGIPDLRDRFFQVAKYAEDGSRQELATVDFVGNLSLAGSLSQNSDRNLKEAITPVDPTEVLARVVELPISRWNYRHDPDTRHLGPMAQDFHAAFSVGPDERHISAVDADGISLAAIQGLHRLLTEKDARLQRLEQENESLDRRLAALEAAIGRAVALSNPDQP